VFQASGFIALIRARAWKHRGGIGHDMFSLLLVYSAFIHLKEFFNLETSDIVLQER